MSTYFNEPIYDDWYDLFDEPFKPYGDDSNFWFVLSYVIARCNFKGGFGKPLVNLRAENGNFIFRDRPDLDFSKYKLVDYQRAPEGGNGELYRVKEYYGYAPDRTFVWTEETRITRPGMHDQSEPSSEQFTSFTLDTSFSRVVIAVDNASGNMHLATLSE